MFHEHDGFHHGPEVFGLLLAAFMVAGVVIGIIALVERSWRRGGPAGSADRRRRVSSFGGSFAQGLSLVGLAIGGGLAFGVLDRVLAHGPP